MTVNENNRKKNKSKIVKKHVSQNAQDSDCIDRSDYNSVNDGDNDSGDVGNSNGSSDSSNEKRDCVNSKPKCLSKNKHRSIPGEEIDGSIAICLSEFEDNYNSEQKDERSKLNTPDPAQIEKI